MRTIDATGKSIDEAIYNGLQELGISIDEVDIEIKQQESKGVLGIGARPAIVRLIERDPSDVIIPAYLTEEARLQRAERPREPRRDRRDDRRRGNDRTGDRNNDRNNDRRRDPDFARAPREPRDMRSDRPRTDPIAAADAAVAAIMGGERAEARPPRENAPRENAPRERRYERSDRPERTERPERAEAPRRTYDYTVEAAEADPGAQFLKGLLAQMGVEGEVLCFVEENAEDDVRHVRLCIRAEHMGALIGHRGETLDALQYLTSLCVNRNRKEQGYTRITIDTEGYRDKREETLTRLARKVAAQVKATGRARTMEPMNPYERRVMHATLQSNPYVTTHSEGEEPFRRVVVEPK